MGWGDPSTNPIRTPFMFLQDIVGAYHPECTKDGQFAPLQCWGSTGYCWCSTPDGVPIANTVTFGLKVHCEGANDSAHRFVGLSTLSHLLFLFPDPLFTFKPSFLGEKVLSGEEYFFAWYKVTMKWLRGMRSLAIFFFAPSRRASCKAHPDFLQPVLIFLCKVWASLLLRMRLEALGLGWADSPTLGLTIQTLRLTL